jgi:hypothetical protein
MPILLNVEYENGTKESLRLPAEIWRSNSKKISKLIVAKDRIKSLHLDPLLETADANVHNNEWPPRPVKSRFRLFKDKSKNPMQEALEAENAGKEEKAKEEPKEETKKEF